MLANIYCIKYIEELKEKGFPKNGYDFVALPENIVRWNGTTCDLLIGPCSCGAWHKEEELADARLGFIK